MKILVTFCVLISAACDAEIHRNRAEFSSFESLEIDSHATSASRRQRNSFLPQQTPSNRNYFRDLISRNEDSNDNNNVEFTIDPGFSSFLLPKHRKPQSEIHGSLPYKYTREVHLPKQGRITGIVREMHVQSRLKNVDQFLGIPYAEAPIGSRRFMPPSSPLPFNEDVKRANKLEAVCPQKLPNLNDPEVNVNAGRYDQIKRLLPHLKRESEDCLYLNLYVTSYGELLSYLATHS